MLDLAKSGITLKLDGFEELLKDIEAAGGSINKAVDSAMKQSAQIVQAELKKQMKGASPKAVDSGLINRMPPPSIEWDGNECRAEVGYKKGAYNPKNLDDGYKAVFINYGTPRIAPREFIKKAKRKSKTPVKKAQEQAFNKILGRLQK